jgi:adenylate cyclase
MAATLKPLHRSALLTVAIGLIVVAAAAFLNHEYPHALERVQLTSADWRLYHLRLPQPTGQVVIARIDDQSIAELGRWPWNRAVQARLVKALADDQAAVIGFDVLMSEADSADVLRDRITAQLRAEGVSAKDLASLAAQTNDRAFAAAIAAQGETYLGYAFSSHQLQEQQAGGSLQDYRTSFLQPPPLAYGIVRKSPGADVSTMHAQGYLPPIPLLNAASRGVAYVDIDADDDGAARSYPAVVQINRRFCVPLFLALADAYAGHAPLSLTFDRNGVAGITLAGMAIPVDEIGRMMVHFRGPAGTIPSYSVADIVAGRIPSGALAGKIVIVGVTGHALGDRFVTPMGGDFPGVEILANAVDNVLAGDFIVRNGTLALEEEVAGLLLGIAVSIAAALIPAFASAMVAAGLLAAYIGYATYRLRESGELLGIVFPIVTIGLTYLVTMTWRYFTEGAEKRFIRHAFEHYLHPDVIASLVDSRDGLKLGGERRHLSILFSDIVGFTTRAERSEAEPLVALLNDYTTVMTNLVLESGGVVDKLMGDGIMAFWGPPLNLPNPARKAVDCALRMLEELAAMAARDERFRDFRIGIGICTGEAIVGNFGGDRSFSYSVIGDTVNLASRLEGLTRQFKVNLLVNQQTIDEAGDALITRPLGRVRVKGKDQLVAVSEVVAREGNGIDAAYYRRFADALGQLREGHSPEAALRAMLAERPGDRVIEMCLERLASADGSLPREMVFEFDTK